MDAFVWFLVSLPVLGIVVLPLSAYLIAKLGVLGWLRGRDKHREMRRKEREGNGRHHEQN